MSRSYSRSVSRSRSYTRSPRCGVLTSLDLFQNLRVASLVESTG